MKEDYMPQGLKWAGAAPSSCDICGSAIHDGHFIDGKTVMGPWANMCPNCHGSYGVGLGVGLGQEYRQLEQVAGGSNAAEG